MNFPIFNRNKKQKENDQKQQETLREKVLADPEAHGLRGSLSDGINKARMLELAKEYETKEADRLNNLAPNEGKQRTGETKKQETETKGEEEFMARIGVQRKEARPLPEILNTRWLYLARSAELQKLLQDRGVQNTEGKSLKELRVMARPLISTRTRRKAKRPAMEKKARVPAPAKPRQEKGLPSEVHTVEELQIMDNGLHVHCMNCGFRMEISPEGIKALQNDRR
jgi:hypothetical protein